MHVKKYVAKHRGRAGGGYSAARYKSYNRGVHLSKGKAKKRRAMKDAPAAI
jgi:hypothetical protein